MDIPAARLIVYEHREGELKEVHSFYTSIGIEGFEKRRDGDQKTPVGVYQITGFIPGRRLHERYGPGALPINYPNELDQLYKRSGHGIWLHGTEPGFVNRAPRASDGCLSLANVDFLTLHRLIGNSPSVPIVIDPTPEWINTAELHHRREVLTRVINEWFEARLASDTTALDHLYLVSNHDSTTQHGSQNQPSSNFSKFAPRLQLEDQQLFGYPGEKRLYLADLLLTNGQQSQLNIRQYWHHTTDNEWRIIGEFQVPSKSFNTIRNSQMITDQTKTDSLIDSKVVP